MLKEDLKAVGVRFAKRSDLDQLRGKAQDRGGWREFVDEIVDC